MSSIHRSIWQGCSFVVMALAVLVASLSAQPPVRPSERPPRGIHPQAIETAVYLELYGHPDTAHRRIEVRAVHERIELSGTVGTEAERLTAERLATFVAPDRKVVSRLQVEPDRQISQVENS